MCVANISPWDKTILVTVQQMLENRANSVREHLRANFRVDVQECDWSVVARIAFVTFLVE
jgi:hypothetical protein